MSDPSNLELALRRLTRPDRVAAFAGALGLKASGRVVPRPLWATLGIPDGAPLRTVRSAAERPGFEMLFLGLAQEVDPAVVARLARAVRNADVTTHRLFAAAGGRHRQILLACFGLEGELRHLVIDRLRPRASDLETLAELVARDGEGPTALAARHARALDRSRVTRQFFDDVRARRGAIAVAWRGIPRQAVADREQLALLFLCRLIFLYFLQRRGHLAADPSYLPGLLARWRRGRREGTFYRAVLVPLFFGALNTRPEHRSPEARALGELPYLNGGLFEAHAMERRHAALDLPDPIVFSVFDQLLERYRFTTRDAADDLAEEWHEVGIDPEMLGRVFEGLMAGDRRGDTGTYYTPSRVVDRLVGSALAEHLGGDDAAERVIAGGDASGLDARRRASLARTLRSLTVLDPACGSGAFLLGALSRIARLRVTLDGGDPAAVRREIVGHSLHGVDLQGDAALLCALRLWLALAAEASADRPVPPLPNLDRRIRQGDALLDPLELGRAAPDDPAGRATAMDPAVRGALRRLAPLAVRYLSAEPGEKESLRRELAEAEAALARGWIGGFDRRLAGRMTELEAAATERDLFGEPTLAARRAGAGITTVQARRTELERLARTLDDAGTLPFFSFPVHFAEAAERGFDLVLSNPPWVRAHRWPAAVGPLVRSRYEVCRTGGRRAGGEPAGAAASAGGQVDLSLLFLERSLDLLADCGTLAMLLPAKTFRSLYAAPARRMLLRETRLAVLEDYSLDQRSIFRADAFAGAIVARKVTSAGLSDAHAAGRNARVTLVRRSVEPLRFEVPQADLPLHPGDAGAPWLLVPPDVRRALRRMQQAGPCIGARRELRLRRGVFTGANDVLIVREARPKIGGLALMRAAGWHTGHRRSRFEAVVEDAALRPLVRGADVAAWRYRTPCHVIWVHGADGRPVAAPTRLAAYLRRHEAVLGRRSGGGKMASGTLFRVSADALEAKLAWHDLAETLNAVAIPARVRSPLGLVLPVVPLNTVYFMPIADLDRAMVLAAFFNSLPVRTFARAIAERAKDARFRFFAWTIAVLPLPRDWERPATVAPLLDIARAAHAAGGVDAPVQQRLDRLVAAAYGLDQDDLGALSAFDRWLRAT